MQIVNSKAKSMTEEQLKELDTLHRAHVRASRRLRKLMVDLFPVGSNLTWSRNGTILSGKVLDYGDDAHTFHVSHDGRHTYRVRASEVISYQKDARA